MKNLIYLFQHVKIKKLLKFREAETRGQNWWLDRKQPHLSRS